MKIVDIELTYYKNQLLKDNPKLEIREIMRRTFIKERADDFNTKID